MGWAPWGQAVRTVMGLGHGVSRGGGRPMPLPDGAREKNEARTRPPQESRPAPCRLLSLVSGGSRGAPAEQPE